MRVLVTCIHVFFLQAKNTWMTATSAVTTTVKGLGEWDLGGAVPA
jgi:hypothetical protein